MFITRLRKIEKFRLSLVQPPSFCTHLGNIEVFLTAVLVTRLLRHDGHRREYEVLKRVHCWLLIVLSWPYWYNSVQLRYFTTLLTVRRIVVSRGKMVHAIEWVAVLPLALLDLGTGEIFVTAVVVSTLLSHVTILVQQRTHKHWRQKYFTCTQAVWWQWQYLHSINCMNDFDARHDNTTNSQQCREVTQLLRYTLFNTSYSHRFQWRQRV